MFRQIRDKILGVFYDESVDILIAVLNCSLCEWKYEAETFFQVFREKTDILQKKLDFL